MDRPELIEAIVKLGDAVLAMRGIRFDEADEYYYEMILVKRSITGESASGPCDVCDDNEAEGWIDSEDVYPSGDDGPPFHPNCVCEEEYTEKRKRVYY